MNRLFEEGMEWKGRSGVGLSTKIPRHAIVVGVQATFTQALRKPYEMDVFIYKKSYIYICIYIYCYMQRCIPCIPCDKLRDALSEYQFVCIYIQYVPKPDKHVRSPVTYIIIVCITALLQNWSAMLDSHITI